jgi:stage V sporulation protein G
MEITEVRVFPVDEDKLRAYVTITLDGCFVVRDLKVIHGNTGLFVAMPAKRRRDGSFKDIAHPLNAQTRQWMERVILTEYDKEMKRQGGSDPVAAEKTPPAPIEEPPPIEEPRSVVSDDDDGD